MKKIIYVLALCLGVYSVKSLSFTVTACSFMDSSIVSYGSSQWVDLKPGGSYTSSDHLKVYLTHLNGLAPTTYTVLFDQIFYAYFLNLPLNPDGSRRVFFTMPSFYSPGKFQLSVNLDWHTERYGFFPLVTDVYKDPLPIETLPYKTLYYNLEGTPIDGPKGFYIREMYFVDDRVSRHKFFLIENE